MRETPLVIPTLHWIEAGEPSHRRERPRLHPCCDLEGLTGEGRSVKSPLAAHAAADDGSYTVHKGAILAIGP